MFQGAHLDQTVNHPAQRRGEGRDAGGPVAAVGDHVEVGLQVVPVLGKDSRQGGRAHLLLALDQHHDIDRRLAVERAQHREMRGHAGLVVRGPATVQPVAALRRSERLSGPLRDLTGRLDVEVGVEADGRQFGRDVEMGDDRRLATRLDDPHPIAAQHLEVPDHRIGGRRDITGMLGLRTDRRDGNQMDQVVQHTGQYGADTFTDRSSINHDPDPTSP